MATPTTASATGSAREVVRVELREEINAEHHFQERFMEFPLLKRVMVPLVESEWIPFGSRLSSSAKQTLSIH